MLDCDKALLFISMKMDGELSAAEAAELDAHLPLCPECRALLADFEAMHAAMPTPAEVPADLKDRIMEQVRLTKVTPLPPKKKLRWKPWISVAAVLALVLLGANALRNQSFDSTASTDGAAMEAAQSEASDAGRPVTDGATESFLLEDVKDAGDIAGDIADDQNAAPNTAVLETAPAASSLPAEAPAPLPAGVDSPETDTYQLPPSRKQLEKAGLDGPWRGVLILPDEYAHALGEAEFVTLEDCRCCAVDAGDFALLAEKAAGWAGAQVYLSGEAIDPDAPQGLVILAPMIEN